MNNLPLVPVKINWDIFRANYADNPQQAFEWLAYLIFCKIYRQPFGVNRYFNQAYRETEAIVDNGQRVAFQAKFYSGQLGSSAHVSELKKCIAGNAADHINKLIIFTNLSWGQTRTGEVSEAKQKLEKLALTQGMELEWFTDSCFEKVVIEDDVLQGFFSSERGAKEAYATLRKRTIFRLKQATSYPCSQGNKLIYPRDAAIAKLHASKAPCILLYGESGVGKSCFLKECREADKHKETQFIIDAEELLESCHLNHLLCYCSAEEFFRYVNHADGRKRLYLDSAEKLLENPSIIQELLSELQPHLETHDWQIIIVMRPHAVRAFRDMLRGICETASIELPLMEKQQLEDWSHAYSFSLPSAKDVTELLQRPIFLREFLMLPESARTSDRTGLYEAIGRNLTGENAATEEALRHIAFRHTNSPSLYLNVDGYAEVVNRLIHRGIFIQEGRYYRFAHDLYEEIALFMDADHKLEVQGLSLPETMSCYPNTALMRRIFIRYLREKWETGSPTWQKRISNALHEAQTATPHDALPVAILTSSGFPSYLRNNAKLLFRNEHALLHRFLRLITLYSVVPADIQTDNSSSDTQNLSFTSRGKEWGTLLSFLLQHAEQLTAVDLPVVMDFCAHVYFGLAGNSFPSDEEGEMKRQLSLLALRCYESPDFGGKNVLRFHSEQLNMLTTFIRTDLKSISAELKAAAANLKHPGKRANRYRPLFEPALCTFPDTAIWAQELPDLQRDLMLRLWLHEPNEKSPRLFDIDFAFGLADMRLHYLNASAYMTPVYYLLQSDFVPTLAFLLAFIDICVGQYAKAEHVPDCPILLPWTLQDGTPSTLYASASLWSLYRGSGDLHVPHLLQSCHMALEKFLLDYADKIMQQEQADAYINAFLQLLHRILDTTHSVSVVAIVAAICTAYPGKCYEISLRLMRVSEFYRYDSKRKMQESTLNIHLNLMDTSSPFRQDCYQERLQALKAPFRRHDLSDIALSYQYPQTDTEEALNQRQEVLRLLDDLYQAARESNDYQRVKRMDSRHLRTHLNPNDGLTYLIPNEFPDLESYMQHREQSIREWEANDSFIIRLRAEQHLKEGSEENVIPITALEQAFSFPHFKGEEKKESPEVPYFGAGENNLYILLYLLVFHQTQDAWWQKDEALTYMIQYFREEKLPFGDSSPFFLFMKHLPLLIARFPHRKEDILRTPAIHIQNNDVSDFKEEWRDAMNSFIPEQEELVEGILRHYLNLCSEQETSDNRARTVDAFLSQMKREELYKLIIILPGKSRKPFTHQLVHEASRLLLPPQQSERTALGNAYIFYMRHAPLEYLRPLAEIILRAGGTRLNAWVLRFTLTADADDDRFEILWDTTAHIILAMQEEDSPLIADYTEQVLPYLFFRSITPGDRGRERLKKIAAKHDDDIRELIRVGNHPSECLYPLSLLLFNSQLYEAPYTEWVWEILRRHEQKIGQLRGLAVLHHTSVIFEHFYNDNIERRKTDSNFRQECDAITEALIQAGSQRARLLADHEC